ncbi:DNA repair protein RadC [Tissierella pigra]|uniref:JAB domain-containing protein n=1 Tax=Tissierella pigra TaxID=2607614 RepID=A0A6N7XLE3_9FIRM|nr:DNA repair protein RadC [Tissierella pigra]MBU5427218.1 DNA repair protein RadC [Tissierella pigra]MSU02859.1 JAB domain-containing protein [Tissierella pigra]
MSNNFILEKNYTIKELPMTERPREKLYSHGPSALSNEELLAIIIRTGNKEDSAIDLARKILSKDNRGLAYLRDTTLQELMEIKGIGRCKAAQILSAIEIGKRLNYKEALYKVKINEPSTIANLYMDEMRYLQKEHFRIALLDTKNQIIVTEEISVGTLNASIVHPRDVFKAAIKRNSNSMILVHNHPSGDPKPSNEDINITNRLVEAGNLIGIKVLDHIIIGDNRYISFKEKNLI